MVKLFQKIYITILWRIVKNRSGYSNKEIAELKKTPWFSKFGEFEKSLYWFKIEMIKTNRCTVGWKEGEAFLYFDFSGMLLTRKCPKIVCPHAIAVLSPVIYTCVDRIGRGADPSKMQFEYVSCTDPGFDNKGMGNNLMKISYERIPAIEYLRYMSGLAPHLFYYSEKARGTNPGGIE